MQQIARQRQEREESIEKYKIRSRRLVLEAHQDLQRIKQEKLIIFYLITKLAYHKLAQHIMTVSAPTAA